MRQHALRLYDLSMTTLASNYDLRMKEERRRSTKELERFFFHVVKLIEPTLFVEAGAKEASASRRARRRLESARVVAFEANPYTYERFAKVHAESGLAIEYLNLALGDESGVVEFNVRKTARGQPSADGQGSLRRRTDSSSHPTVRPER
jgi:hypothetical protein